MIKLNKYLKDFFAIRKYDIIVASFPKSGNTRLRLALAKYFQLMGVFDKEPFSYNLTNKILPEIGKGNIDISREIFKNECGEKKPVLFIKSHLPYNFLKFFLNENKIIHIQRLSHTTLMSYYDFLIARETIKDDTNFSSFLRSKRGVIGFSKYLKSWKNVQKSVIHFDKLMKDDILEITRALKDVDYIYDNEIMTKAIIETRRKNVVSLVNNLDVNKDYNFASKKNRDFENYFNKNDVDFYNLNLGNSDLSSL